jgi:NADPH:quinone reductase-like Zn-dependent oxidoreductase
MKAIMFDHFGNPADVLRVGDAPMPEPGRNEVRVRMLASPINPSDLMTVRGQYGKPPKLPYTPGYEGAGVVDAVGPGFLKRLRGLKPGKRVAVLNTRGGNWAECVVIPVKQAVPVPDDLPIEQVAMFFVNPATALVMTRNVLKVPRGAWLLQTAAGSALGRMVIRLGQHYGFRTINVVRRREQADELLQLGGDAAVCTADESIEARVNEITGGAGVRYAIDAVGGETATAVVRSLGPGGRMLVYGTLANEPMSLDSRMMIMNQRIIEGFWLSIWAREQRIVTMLRLFREIIAHMRAQRLISEVGATFPLDQVQAAAQQAEKPGRGGKVLLRIAAL